MFDDKDDQVDLDIAIMSNKVKTFQSTRAAVEDARVTGKALEHDIEVLEKTNVHWETKVCRDALKIASSQNQTRILQLDAQMKSAEEGVKESVMNSMRRARELSVQAATATEVLKEAGVDVQDLTTDVAIDLTGASSSNGTKKNKRRGFDSSQKKKKKPRASPFPAVSEQGGEDTDSPPWTEILEELRANWTPPEENPGALDDPNGTLTVYFKLESGKTGVCKTALSCYSTKGGLTRMISKEAQDELRRLNGGPIPVLRLYTPPNSGISWTSCVLLPPRDKREVVLKDDKEFTTFGGLTEKKYEPFPQLGGLVGCDVSYPSCNKKSEAFTVSSKTILAY